MQAWVGMLLVAAGCRAGCAVPPVEPSAPAAPTVLQDSRFPGLGLSFVHQVDGDSVILAATATSMPPTRYRQMQWGCFGPSWTSGIFDTDGRQVLWFPNVVLTCVTPPAAVSMSDGAWRSWSWNGTVYRETSPGQHGYVAVPGNLTWKATFMFSPDPGPSGDGARGPSWKA